MKPHFYFQSNLIQSNPKKLKSSIGWLDPIESSDQTAGKKQTNKQTNTTNPSPTPGFGDRAELNASTKAFSAGRVESGRASAVGRLIEMENLLFSRLISRIQLIQLAVRILIKCGCQGLGKLEARQEEMKYTLHAGVDLIERSAGNLCNRI